MPYPNTEHPYWRYAKTQSKTNVYVRLEPTIDSVSLASYGNDIEMFYFPEANSGKWTPIKNGLIFGWMHTDFVSFKEINPYTDTFPEKGAYAINTDTDRVNIRALPSTNGKVLDFMYPEDRYHIYRKSGGWYLVYVRPLKSFGWVFGGVVEVDYTESDPVPTIPIDKSLPDFPEPEPEPEPPPSTGGGDTAVNVMLPEFLIKNTRKEDLALMIEWMAAFPIPEVLKGSEAGEDLGKLLKWLAMIVRNSGKFDEYTNDYENTESS